MNATELTELIQSASTVILSVLTGIYVWLTHKALTVNKNTVSELRRQFDEINRPQVVVEIDTDGWPITNLVVKNYGPSAAFNIRLSVDPELRRNDKDPTPRLIANGISYLPPGKKIVEYIGTTDQLFPAKYDQEFKGTVHYEKDDGTNFVNRFSSNSRPQYGMLTADHPKNSDPSEDLRLNLRRIAKAIEDLK